MGREPILTISFDLYQDAQRFIDRQKAIGAQRRIDVALPHFELVDGYEQRRDADAENQAAD